MRAETKKMGFGSTPINADSPFAERELTLSDIDSMFQNGAISEVEARNMAIGIALGSRDTETILKVVLAK